MVSRIECAIVHQRKWVPFSKVEPGAIQTYTYVAENGNREAYVVQCTEDNKITGIVHLTEKEAFIFDNGDVYPYPGIEIESFIDLKKGDTPFIAEIKLDTIGEKLPVRFFHQEGNEYPGDVYLPQVEG